MRVGADMPWILDNAEQYDVLSDPRFGAAWVRTRIPIQIVSILYYFTQIKTDYTLYVR